MAVLSRLETSVFNIIASAIDYYDDGTPIGLADDAIEQMAMNIVALLTKED